MMLAFVTSLRHPKNAVDYSRVEDLLMGTLRSIENQTSDDYVVIVVGNRAPRFRLPDRVHFVQVNFRAPAPRANRASRAPFIRDKGTKIGVGLIKAREFSPDYVMIVDADDFVHRDLVAFTQQHPGQDGWVITDGWMYSKASTAFREQPHFNRTCGTSFIIPFSAYGVPEDLGVDASRGVVKTAYGERLSRIIGAHKHALEWYAAQGMDVQPLPFRGAVYHVDTGENHSRDRMLRTAESTRITPAFAAEFGIRPRFGRLGSLWAFYCSAPIARLTAPLAPLRELAQRLRHGLRRRILSP